MGGLTALGILFVALKLLGFITWSWWWVILPFFVPAILVLLFLGGNVTYILHVGGYFAHLKQSLKAKLWG